MSDERADAATRMRDFLDAYDKLFPGREYDTLFAVPNSDARLLVSDLRLLSEDDDGVQYEPLGYGGNPLWVGPDTELRYLPECPEGWCRAYRRVEPS